MKKIQSMMLMLLVAVMGLCVQSCGSDDNGPDGGDVLESFTLQAKIIDSGNLGDEAVAQINMICAAMKRTDTATENSIKKALDATIPAFAASLPTKGENDVNAIYTIRIFVTNSADKEIYGRNVEVKDGQAKY